MKRRKKTPARSGSPHRSAARTTTKPVRYAVVGAGHIAQNAVLPAFAAARNSRLTALFSDDPRKRNVLAREYGIEHLFGYADFASACRADLFDAVYIALPNDMHRRYAQLAAAAGIHILCEKPLAMTSADCRAMISAAKAARVHLMTAYRLHFEPANLRAVQLGASGKLGDLRLFNSSFTMQARPGNVRLSARKGGGPLYDIGIYCINAARYLFRSNPTRVSAHAARSADPRFRQVDEAVSAVLTFPDDRLAMFTCSFGAADTGWYQLIGSKGNLVVDPAYEYQGHLEHRLTIAERTKEQTFARHDQFAAELVYFSNCIRTGVGPEPGGVEGLIDVRIIEAINRSIRTGRAVALTDLPQDTHPSIRQKIVRPPPRRKRRIHVQAPHT